MDEARATTADGQDASCGQAARPDRDGAVAGDGTGPVLPAAVHAALEAAGVVSTYGNEPGVKLWRGEP